MVIELNKYEGTDDSWEDKSSIRRGASIKSSSDSRKSSSKLLITFSYLVRANSFIEGEIEFQILTPILVKKSTIFSVLENLT